METVKATVQNRRGDFISGAHLSFLDKASTEVIDAIPDRAGDYVATLDSSKRYSAIVMKPGYVTAAVDVSVPAGGGPLNPLILEEAAGVGSLPISSTQGSRDSMDPAFSSLIDDQQTSLEAPISVEEAKEATTLFSVVTLMLAGMVQDGDKFDVLGVDKLYFGLQKSDDTEIKSLSVSEQVIADTVRSAKTLHENLDKSRAEFDFLRREARRQFNLGTTNSVVANTQFPGLFKRLVEVGSDVRISIDLRKQKENPILDKVKLEEAYFSLRSLRDTILQTVRSLSKYGTRSTSLANAKWTAFAGDAMRTLIELGRARTNVDTDEQTPWAVLALLTKKTDSEIMPSAALYRHGFQLLKLAVDIYERHRRDLETNDSDKLVDIFQPAGSVFWTTKIREQTDVIQRYPLTTWG